MGKTSRSFSVDEDIDAILSEREDLNASAPVNRFLREYLASGQGEEAALAVRLEQVEAELADARKRVEQLERERDRLDAALEDRRSDLRKMLTVVEQKVQDGEFPRDNVDPGNPAIQNWAAKAGVRPQRFVDELESRIEK